MNTQEQSNLEKETTQAQREEGQNPAASDVSAEREAVTASAAAADSDAAAVEAETAAGAEAASEAEGPRHGDAAGETAAASDAAETSESGSDAAESDPNRIELLEQALAEERRKLEECQQRLLRLHADFDNFRKRTQREKEEFAKYAARSLLEKLLPAIDNLERAIQSAKDSQNHEALAQGVEMVYRQIMDALAQEGAQPIEAVGKPFDPYYHHAVMQEESKEHEPGTVLEVLQKGYMLKDKVIRPALVKVST